MEIMKKCRQGSEACKYRRWQNLYNLVINNKYESNVLSNIGNFGSESKLIEVRSINSLFTIRRRRERHSNKKLNIVSCDEGYRISTVQR